MTRHVWTAEEQARILALHDAGAGGAEIARALGQPWNAVRQQRDTLVRRRGETAQVRAGPVPPGSETREVESPASSRILTLDELLNHAKVDRAVWDVERFVVNKWEVGAKGPDGKITVAPIFQVKAWLHRAVPASLHDFRTALLADVTADTKHRPRFRFKAATPTAGEYLVEVDLADLHIGKLAWGEETGTDYDSAIAERLAREAVAELLWHAERYPVERCSSCRSGTISSTTRSPGNTTAGTPQDADTRWLLNHPRAHPARPPEHLDHARQGEMALGEVLAAEFGPDPRITFDCSPAPRKYVQYGANLIGFTHGDGEPHAKLPQLMAVEQAQRWALTTHREFHVGHLHTKRTTEPVTVDDKLGVTVRILRSLSGVDAWHAAKGYRGTRGAEAYVYRKAGGVVANFLTYVQPMSESASASTPAAA